MRLIVTAILSACLIAFGCGPDDSTGGEPGGFNIGENNANQNNTNNGEECPYDIADLVADDLDDPSCDDDWGCPEGQQRFDDELCGCGCRYVDSGGECPDEDDGYTYTSQDPDECQLTDIDCAQGSTPFYDEDCGCGCQQICPGELDGYDYMSEDPTECEMMRFDCPEGEALFSNECGCGCRPVDDICEPWDAQGEGDCDEFFGFGFDGDECIGHGGCNCVGADCDLLVQDPDLCEESVRHCSTITDPGDRCDPWDIEPQGACDMELGWGWDGDQCISYSGCSCDGADCDQLFDGPGECEDQMSLCE